MDILNFYRYLCNLGFKDAIKTVCKIKEGVIDIVPSETCTEEQLKELNDIKDSYNWEKPDWWMPQVKEFRERIFIALPDAGKVILAPTLMALTDEFIASPNMPIYWQALVNTKPTWLTEEVLQEIINIAQECNIPLTGGK